MEVGAGEGGGGGWREGGRGDISDRGGKSRSELELIFACRVVLS